MVTTLAQPTTKNSKSHLQKGVSVVELAITLVAIALLVGTIFSSSLLINNARINVMMGQMYKFKTTVLMFDMRYYAIPGDMPNASAFIQGVMPAQNGNGNEQINFSEISAGETFLPWVHLEKAGFIKYSETATYTGRSCCGNPNWGATSTYKEGNNGPNTARPAIPDDISNISGKNIPVYMFFYSAGDLSGNKIALTWSSENSERPFYAPVAPAAQARIDSKYDDGKPLTGNIIADAGHIAGVDSMVANNPNVGCVADGVYLNTEKTPGLEGCMLILRLDE